VVWSNWPGQKKVVDDRERLRMFQRCAVRSSALRLQLSRSAVALTLAAPTGAAD